MTVTVQNTLTTSTFDFWRNRTNELADAMTNKAVTVASTAATGNAAVNGAISATYLIANAYVSIANATSNISIIVPSTSAVSNGQYYLNANGSWSAVVSGYNPTSNGQVITTGLTSQVIDSYAIASYMSAEYLVSVNDNAANNKYSSKMLTMHDSVSGYVTEFAAITSNSVVGTFSADSNTTHVRLNFTPALANTTVKFVRTIV